MADLPTGTVTLLFTDIAGSTQLLQRLGPRYGDVLAAYHALLRAIVTQHGGHEVDTQGDSFFVAFERARDAVQAAVAIQRALAAHPWPQGVTMATRIGLHTGEPQRSHEGYVGLDVHRAARIAAAGHGGQVLLSAATGALVRDDLPAGISLRDLGEHRLKDLRHPKHLFQVVIAGLPSDFAPLTTLAARPNNLPLQLTSFIGRDQEVAAVRQRLLDPQVRLLTLTGPGGTGKTRIALQVAAGLLDDFADGVWFADLTPIADPTHVAATIATTLGVTEVGGQPLLHRLTAFLRDKHLLLVLDNFEQVSAAALLVADLLKTTPRLHMLVTSRSVLHLSSEQEYPVPPLELPDLTPLPPVDTLRHSAAVALFRQRAQAVQPAFQLTAANAAAVAAICHRLDGLPLAIELAAARVKLFPPQALLGRLDQRLKTLTAGARDLPVRQQSLRGTIEWSYKLLTADEQRLFARLAVFVGGCSLEAAEAVCAAEGDLPLEVLDGLASLVDKSLVRQTERADGEPRFTMLETIREYARERLQSEEPSIGAGAAVRERHALFFLTLAEAATMHNTAARQQMPWLHACERDRDNLRAALHWAFERGNVALALRLSSALADFYILSGHSLQEVREWLAAGLAAARAQPRSNWGRAHLRAMDRLGWVAALQGDSTQAQVSFEEWLRLAEQVGDTPTMAEALRSLAFLVRGQGDRSREQAYLEQSLRLCQDVGDASGLAWSLHDLGYLAQRQGDEQRAQALLEEAVRHFRERDDTLGVARSLVRLGHLALAQGGTARARALLQESLVQAQVLGHGAVTWGLEALAGVAATSGQSARAARLFGAAEHVRTSMGQAPYDRAEYDSAIAAARAHLNDATWQAAWAEGEAMTPEQAVAYALDEPADGTVRIHADVGPEVRSTDSSLGSEE